MAIKESNKRRAAAYIRVSTEEQTEYSPESQIKIIGEYSARKNIILLNEHIYSDEGISGRRAVNRPAFMKMIETAKTKPAPFDTVLVWKYSRFARSREDSIIYKSMLKKQCGIDVISVSEELSGDKTSILIEAMLEAMDEYYSLNLGEEVRRGMTEKFSRGETITKAPIGYLISGGNLTPDIERAQIVQRIFTLFLNGTPMKEIAEILNLEGHSTKSGSKFSARSIKYILTNPTYAGYLRMKKRDEESDYYNRDSELVKGIHEAIITYDDFEAASKMINFR